MGAGKATFPIAAALEDILGDRISDGLVICKYGQQGRLAHCRLHLAAHPIPDEAGMAGARDMMALAGCTRPGDIVFGCITGGSSALLPDPVAGISLDEKKAVNRRLLTCGANIIEINAVRKHLSRIKGGRLAMAIHPQAHLINLTVSDVIGDALDYITDPTVADTSTLADARANPGQVRPLVPPAGQRNGLPETGRTRGRNAQSGGFCRPQLPRHHSRTQRRRLYGGRDQSGGSRFADHGPVDHARGRKPRTGAHFSRPSPRKSV